MPSRSLLLRASFLRLLGPGRRPNSACLPAQVDMFSYGMVLYELLSGQRPALGHHQLQIVKKLSKGIRPVLGQPEEVQFHRLQALMMECWDTKPEKVRRAERSLACLPLVVGAVGLQCMCVHAHLPSLRTAEHLVHLVPVTLMGLVLGYVCVCVCVCDSVCLSVLGKLPFKFWSFSDS